MKKLFLLSIPVFLSAAAFAQLATVQGTVTNTNNVPVANHPVHINSDSTNGGWIGVNVNTDVNGHYSYTVPSSLTISNGLNIYTYTQNCNNSYIYHTNVVSGATVTSDFVLCVTPPPHYNIAGTIYADSLGADSGTVYIIKKTMDSVTTGSWILTLVDSVNTDILGNYSVQVPIGSYLVKAALKPSSLNYSTNLPTYYNGSLSWSGATTVNVVNNNVNVTYSLMPGVNPGGPAFIGGSVLVGANKTTAVGDPLANRSLLLTDMNNNPVAYTYSDANGQFSITNLAYGSYKLFGDRLNLNNPALVVTLDANHQGITNIVFKENSTSFAGGFATAASVKDLSENLKKVAAYPNPAGNVLNVAGLQQIKGNKTLQLTSISGQVLYSETVSGNDVISINTAALSAGMYLLHIQTSEGTTIMKIARQ